MAAIAMLAAAEEYDGAAQTRLEENEAIRAILRDSFDQVEDATLRERLVELSEKTDTSLRVSSLNANNQELREALIKLHVYVEDHLSEPWARGANAKIWQELRASTRRHPFSQLNIFV